MKWKMNEIVQSEFWLDGEWTKPASGEYLDDKNPNDDLGRSQPALWWQRPEWAGPRKHRSRA